MGRGHTWGRIGDRGTVRDQRLGTVHSQRGTLDPLYPRGVHNYFRSAFLRTADDASLRVLMDLLATLPNALTEIHLQHLGGAVGRVPADATAFALRDQEFIVNIFAPHADGGGLRGCRRMGARRDVRSRSGRRHLREFHPVIRIRLSSGRRTRRIPTGGSSS